MSGRRAAGTLLLLPLLPLLVATGGRGTAGGPEAAPVVERCPAGDSSPSAAGVRDTAARPSVHVITTGGTIASRRGENLAGRELVSAVPELGDVARITVEEFSSIGSSKMTPAHWLEIGRRVRGALAERPDLDGVVVTHGTDTMEETAYFLHLTLSGTPPVVMTGAMRPPDAPGADGPANLLDAVRAAAAGASRGRGVLVVLNDEIHRAAAVRKAHTTRPDAFVSVGDGPVGEAGPDAVEYAAPARPGPLRGRFGEALSWDRLPPVRVVYSYPGADGAGLRGVADGRAVGVVVASVGRGNLSAAQEEAVRTIVQRGVPVVLSSRAMAGPVPVGGGEDGVVGAGPLTPQKARVLASLALTETDETEELAELFARAR